jgi:histidine triad (HIT) family protein
MSDSTDDCIFCRIVDGDLPARTVYEDDETLAFLDTNPLAPGHTLVVPKAHHEQLEEVGSETAASMFQTLHALVGPVQEAVDADGSTVGFNNGPAAGQEVPHVHGHIIPRFDGDGGGPIHGVVGTSPHLSDGELDDICDDIVERT